MRLDRTRTYVGKVTVIAIVLIGRPLLIGKIKTTPQGGDFRLGLPDRIRTYGLQSRSLTRYPAVPRVDVEQY